MRKVGHDIVRDEGTDLTEECAFDCIKKTFQNQDKPHTSPKKATHLTHHFPEDSLSEKQGYSELLRSYCINLSLDFPFWFRCKAHYEERGSSTSVVRFT